jgi:hypothetical protein
VATLDEYADFQIVYPELNMVWDESLQTLGTQTAHKNGNGTNREPNPRTFRNPLVLLITTESAPCPQCAPSRS